MKTITIHQNNGDDVLEMTVEVTNKEYAMMEKIRKTDPSVWEGREFELLKTARESVNSTKTNHKFNWKIWIVVAIVLAVAFGVIAILTTNGSEKIEEKDLLSFESQYQQSSTQEENLRRMYNKLTSLGMESSLDKFIDYLDASDEHRQKVYNKLVNNGSKGSYDQFLEFIGYDNVEISANTQQLYNKLNEIGAINGNHDQFVRWLYNQYNRVLLYNRLKDLDVVSGSIYDFEAWLGLNFSKKRISYNLPSNLVDLEILKKRKAKSSSSNNIKEFKSSQYNFQYQYNDIEYKLIEKINKNSHCVMKLQSPSDAMKSILISVWEDVGFSTAYDSDFIDRVKQQDRELDGSVISSAVKTKVGGKSALKSELKISPMGSSYYTANYRIIEKNRMYQISIYIPFKEYNNDKTYADRCVEHFKFN